MVAALGFAGVSKAALGALALIGQPQLHTMTVTQPRVGASSFASSPTLAQQYAPVFSPAAAASATASTASSAATATTLVQPVQRLRGARASVPRMQSQPPVRRFNSYSDDDDFDEENYENYVQYVLRRRERLGNLAT